MCIKFSKLHKDIKCRSHTVNIKKIFLLYYILFLGRIILEVGGKCEFKEVKDFLDDVAAKLPFKAMAISQEILDKMKEKEKWEEENNQNKYTMKYIIQNNLGGCYRWLSPTDMKYFCKYV